MPLPLFFIGVGVATGLFGAGKTAKAVADNVNANKINTSANAMVDKARNRLDVQRDNVSASLNSLGELKLYVLNHSVMEFLTSFEKIKNVDFVSSLGIEELENLHIDQGTFDQLKELGNFALHVAGGMAAGAAGGMITAVGAWGLATAFASASTGASIASLAGAAATNATLAFFGGGSLAAGGLGVAGGMMVLGGLVAGPALMVMGLISGSKSQEKLNAALSNKAQAKEIAETLENASYQCSAIRRRTYLFYDLLVHLDALFLPLIHSMEQILETEGTDYSAYTDEAKREIAKAASLACSIKAVLDTPILTEEGNLTEESRTVVLGMSDIIDM